MVGKVFLVGAGPGDPGLITVKGLQCLEAADTVIYDRLIDQRLLSRAKPGAELIDVGKIPGDRPDKQMEINSLLVTKAKEGRNVVRLKGGDPFIFGRGGEEAEVLAGAGIPLEVVPGVTSVTAVPAYAGIPLTHRRIASSFTVVSGSEDPSKEESAIAWDRLATGSATLVVLMGWESLPRIVKSLLDHGRSPTTPIALIRWGTEPYQQTVVGTLDDIIQRGQQAHLSPPVVAVIGEVVGLRERIRWFDNKPLFGKRVLVTRSRTQASVLSQLLQEQGAIPLEVPTIEIKPLDSYDELNSVLQRLEEYDWVIFTSVNGVEGVFRCLQSLKQDSRAFHQVKVAAIGPATAKALEERGIVADFTPVQYLSEAIVEGFKGQDVKGARILLPRADIGQETLALGLAALGARVDQVHAYMTVFPQDSYQRVAEAFSNGVDIATFTSSSTVRNLISLLDGKAGLLQDTLIACIGPVTADTARELGLKVDIVAKEHTIPGLVCSLVENFQQEGR